MTSGDRGAFAEQRRALARRTRGKLTLRRRPLIAQVIKRQRSIGSLKRRVRAAPPKTSE